MRSMSDSTEMQFSDPIPKSPSVYRLWQLAQKRGKSRGEREDIYRALLEEFGHRNVEVHRW